MDKKKQTIEAFWDDFAEEYAEIRQASTVPVVDTLKHYLLQQQILPCGTFLDLAGGPGNYLTAFQELVTAYTLVDISSQMLALAQGKCQKHARLLHASQAEFLSNASTYNVVFTAMNPALRTSAELYELLQLATSWCLIFRMVKEDDELFSHYESVEDPDWQLNEVYKTYLTEEQIPFQSKMFTFEWIEEVDQQLFSDYFEEKFTHETLQLLIAQHFGKHTVRSVKHTVTYELLLIDRRKNG
ncbi:methyltransferase domain-containing protein [Enterococcus faecalis]